MVQGHPSVTKLVCFDKPSAELKAKIPEGTTLYDFWEELNNESLDAAELVIPTDISLETIFTLSYTSGTTGVPKGAIVSNKNMISALKDVEEQVISTSEETLISFLPLAHVFGRVVYFQMLECGSRIGNYGGDIKKIIDDLSILKPTYFPCVPRLFNRVHDLMKAGIAKLDQPVQAAFWKAYDIKY